MNQTPINRINVYTDMGHLMMKPHVPDLYKLILQDIESKIETLDGINIRTHTTKIKGNVKTYKIGDNNYRVKFDV